MTTAIVSKFLTVDPYLKNAYSSTPKFDLDHKLQTVPRPRGGRDKIDVVKEAVEVAIRSNPPKEWELDVRSLCSSRKWLTNYGLKKYRLQLNQILPSIGFKLSDEFDQTLKRPVSSRYGGGLFRHLMRADGKTFNVACNKEKLVQLEKRLLQAVYLFRRRLEWLTTESRRVFGVIEERAVTIILDIRNMSPQQFDQYRTALERVLREQVSQLAKFNIIRASEDVQLYAPECAPVSHDTLETAIQWVWNLDRLAPVSNTSAAEAIMAALKDQHNEAIYLFTEGTSVDSGKEVLKEKVSVLKHRAPVNVVSFNCDSSETVKFLKDFCNTTGGKFHAYGVVMELDAYEVEPAEGPASKANVLLRRKTFGGIPPGAGCREDVVLVFEEMEEARNNLAQVRMLIENTPDPTKSTKGKEGGESPIGQQVSRGDEQYMNSSQWLEIYGLAARKLGIYDVLGGVAFRHQDGVVDIMSKPGNDSQTDAIRQQKLVQARYCDRFPVVRWKDGRVVHVQVTPEVHRGYEERVMVALNKIQQRMDWLNQGSRALFGTLCEDQMYILIDTSASMQPSLGFVKQKLFVLMQEQLRHKKKFNIVTFNSKAVAWKDRLVDVSERSLQSAWSWVQNLSCWGSTNTYAAIQMAMADSATQAIYLLSDGRPDQPPKSIIAQVHMKKYIPIHTISFNCEDREANQFLFDLAEATSGRYHYFNDRGKPVDQPESWESIDMKLLKEEMRIGWENLQKLADLRDECTSMAWRKDTDSLRQSIETSRESKSAVPPLDPKDLYRNDLSPRPPSTPPPPRQSNEGPSVSRSSMRSDSSPPVSASCPVMPAVERPNSADARQRGSGGLLKKLPKRPKSAKVAIRKPMVAGHTRTSLLRTLSSSGRFDPNEWLLPETKQMFEVQTERQKSLAKRSGNGQEKKELLKVKRTKKLLKANQMSSKQWLSKHGLVAKRLTILDALGSTFVAHKPKYVSILDKNVMSKVFDDVLPIAHVSRRQEIRLVNPNGVNLKDYETKLQAALDKFKQRLNTIVWNALSSDDKEKFDSSEPVDFEQNRKKILECLEESDWPLKEQDISLLTKEIARAEKFLNQSKALRKAAAGLDESEEEEEIYDREDYKEDRKSPAPASDRSYSPKSNASATPPRSASPSPPRSAASASPAHSPVASPARSPAASPPRSAASSPPRSASNSPPRSTRNSEALGQVVRSVDRVVEGKVKESSNTIRSKVRIKLDTLRGQKVIARKDHDGLYYPAKVIKCADPRHASVKYTDGSTAEVLTRNVIPTGGAVARPPLMSGDCVLMRVVNMDSDDECYVPALIQFGPKNSEGHTKFYTVVMYNGQKASTLRTYLIKISKERFELASMYIADQQNESRKEAEEIVYVRSNRRRKRDSRRKVSRSPSPEIEVEITQTQRPRSRSRSASPSDGYVSKDDSTAPQSVREHRQESHRSHVTVKEKTQKRSHESTPKKSPEHSPKRSGTATPIQTDDNLSHRSGEETPQVQYEDDFFEERQAEEDVPQQKSGEKSPAKSGPNTPVLSNVASEDEAEKSPRSPEAEEVVEDEVVDEEVVEEEEVQTAADEADSQETGRNRELERLRQELLDQQAKQERQKKKLKKKAKQLSEREKELDNRQEEQEQAAQVVVPSADHLAGMTPHLIQLRKSLSHVRPGEEVLARWSDDGWYYRGIVRHYHGDCSYNIEDSTGFVERIWREDIISENDNPGQVYEIDNKVVALHPDYSFSYAPATVVNISDSEVEVLLYDGTSTLLPWNEAYHISEEKFQQDGAYIRKREKEMVGAAVVCREDKTGAYYPGSVKRKLDGKCEYLVGWSDGSSSVQLAIHIFSAFTRRRPLTIGDKVLAMSDPVHVQFLPGYIIGSDNDKLMVQFCDGEMREGVDPTLCYWLGQRYYDAAVKYFKIKGS